MLVQHHDQPWPSKKIVVHLELEALPLAEAVQAFEEYYIRCLIEENHGHKSSTSEMLGINRKTLYRKIKRYGW